MGWDEIKEPDKTKGGQQRGRKCTTTRLGTVGLGNKACFTVIVRMMYPGTRIEATFTSPRRPIASKSGDYWRR